MKAIGLPVSHSAFTIGTPSFQLKQENVVGLDPKKNKIRFLAHSELLKDFKF